MRTNNRYNKKHLWQDLIIIFALGLIPLIWFKGGITVAGSDAGYPLLDPVRFFLERLFIWDARVNCGMDSAIYPTSLFFHGMQAFFGWLGFSAKNSQKLQFVFWFNLVSLSIYYLISVIQYKKPDRVQRLTAVFFYSFSPLLFNVWEVGKAANLSAYVAMPVILALLIQAFERRMGYVKAACLIGIFSVVVSEIGASPSIIAVPVAVFLVYSLFFFFKQLFSGAGEKRLSQTAGFLLLTGGIYILINAYWWLPYLKEILDKLAFRIGSELEAFNFTNWLAGISTYTSFFNVARFQGAWDWYWGWNDEPYVPYAHHYFSNTFLILLSGLVPILAASALLVKRKNFYVVFFAFIAVAGNLLAIGAHMPFGNVFLWMTRNVPFFSVFRSPYYKFSLATALAYAYLVSVTLSVLYNKIKNSLKMQAYFGRHKVNSLALFVVVLSIAFNFVYNFPMLNGKIIKIHDNGKLFSLGLKVPQYVFDFSRWMESLEEDYRVMALPQQSLDCYRWGYVAPPHLLNLLITKPVLWGSTGTTNTDIIRHVFYDALYKNKTNNTASILNILNAKYLLLANDAWYDFYGDTDSPEFVRRKMASQKNIKFKKRFGEWELYENQEPCSAIHASLKTQIVSGNVNSMISLSVGRYLDNAALIFSKQPENSGTIQEILDNKLEDAIIFCDTQIEDFALDMMENKYECVVEKKEEEVNFVAGSEGVYRVLLEKASCGEIKREITVLLDNERPSLENSIEEKSYSQNYINIGNVELIKGKHKLRVLLTEVEKADSVSALNFLIISEAEANDRIEAIKELVSEEDVNFNLLFSTQNMSFSINDESSRVPKGLTISKLENFYEPSQWRDGEIWHWLKTNQQDNIFIRNDSEKPIRGNFGFKVMSFERERMLYVYLNNELFKMTLIPENKPIDVVINDMEFEPGDNVISFYTAYQWDKLFGHLCNFAFRDFKLGNLDFEQTVYIPKADKYKIELYPTADMAQDNKTIYIGGKEISLRKTGNDPCIFETEMVLDEGTYPLYLSQEKAENYVLSVALSRKISANFEGQLEYNRINPVKYKAKINNPGPFFLVFSEAFSPNWKAYMRPLKNRRIDGKSIVEQSLILDGLRDKNEIAEIKKHYLINGYANGWYVNFDGASEPYEIIVEYSSQRLFEAGLAISALAFVLCLVGLGISSRGKKKR
ncbi:MAG: alpha-(1-_3)-arabinofuranosyltransferase family protein [Candidatus Omnitrophota bacterium]